MSTTTRHCSPAPDIAGVFDIQCKEMMCYLYLPIRMRGSDVIKIPPRLDIFRPLIKRVANIEPRDTYLYITAKHLYVTPGNPGNRPGWHSDGFLTSDVNYIWYDSLPTVFCVQGFDVTPEHGVSMRQFEEQVRAENFVTFPPGNLLRLTQAHIHRTPDFDKGQVRTFVKITSSVDRYNLEGNSHNYMFDYDWKMFPREEVRNHPVHTERDAIIEAVGEVV